MTSNRGRGLMILFTLITSKLYFDFGVYEVILAA